MTRNLKTRRTFDFLIPINVILSFENILIEVSVNLCHVVV